MGGRRGRGGRVKARVVIGLVVGAVFMGLAFWGVPLKEFVGAFHRLDVRVLAPIAFLFFLQEVIRSYRQLVFMRPIAPHMRFDSSLSIFFISFLFIHLFPARLGELVRPYLLSKREQVSLIASTGVVIAERAVDGLAATLMLVGMLLLAPLPEHLVVGGHAFHLATTARTAGYLVATPALVLVLTMTLAPKLVPAALRQVHALAVRHADIPCLERCVGRVEDVTNAFAEGFQGLRITKSLSLVLVLTVLGWLVTALMYWLMAVAFGLGDLVGPGEAFGVMVITLWASLLPAPPGMAGVQEAFGRGALALFGVSGPALAPVGLAYAVLIHWGQVLLQALGAWFFLARDGLSLRAIRHLPDNTDTITSVGA